MGFGFRSHALFSGGSRPRPPKPERPVSAVALVGGSLDATNMLLDATAVAELADLFVKRKWTLVWCGMGSGLAGNIAKAVLAKGGQAEAVVVTGQEPTDVPEGARRHEVADFHERGRALFDRAQGAVVVPGGIGTLAELTELLAWRGAGLYAHPVIVLDPANWFGPLKRYVAKLEKAGAAPSGSSKAARFVKDVESARKLVVKV